MATNFSSPKTKMKQRHHPGAQAGRRSAEPAPPPAVRWGFSAENTALGAGLGKSGWASAGVTSSAALCGCGGSQFSFVTRAGFNFVFHRHFIDKNGSWLK